MRVTAGMNMRLHLVRVLRATVYCFNIHTLVLCAISCMSCYVAMRMNWSYRLEFSLMALGITIPLTFNITQAFTRRERALITLAEMKASIIALYWQHRDWPQDDNFPDSLGNNRSAWAVQFANVALEFLTHVQQYITTPEGYESLSEIRLRAKRSTLLALSLGDTRLQPVGDSDSLAASFILRVQRINRSLPGYTHIQAAYGCLSRMSVMNEQLTFKARYSRGGEGGLSRSAQYLRYLMAQMEQLRMIKIYRTPFMLRYCCSVLIHIGAIVLGPYFVHIGVCDADATELWGLGCPAPFIMACIYAVICMLLLNVQVRRAAAASPEQNSTGPWWYYLALVVPALQRLLCKNLSTEC
eukprot:GHRQ01028311.1.p1 GENE.GHRQ01028311.1~~GHRQ01028311.1.p1  ORF type:complete len:355 (+),score=109.23 GHRQ01028311.1:157-1221(+)